MSSKGAHVFLVNQGPVQTDMVGGPDNLNTMTKLHHVLRLLYSQTFLNFVIGPIGSSTTWYVSVNPVRVYRLTGTAPCAQWSGRDVGAFSQNFTISVDTHDTAAFLFTPGVAPPKQGDSGISTSDEIAIIFGVLGVIMGALGLYFGCKSRPRGSNTNTIPESALRDGTSDDIVAKGNPMTRC